MKFVLFSLILFALAAYGGSRTYDDYRIGKMQVISKGFSPLFDRIGDPLFFWGATVLNTAMTAVCGVGGIIVLLPLVLQK